MPPPVSRLSVVPTDNHVPTLGRNCLSLQILQLKSAIEPLMIKDNSRRNQTISILQRVTSIAQGKGWNGKYVITKESLAKLGLNVLLAYGFVSNVSYITCIILAWIGHGKAFGLSPLAPGQWKAFLLIYSGFFAANNVLRPLRFSLSLALSPAFDAMIHSIHTQLGIRKRYATGLLVFLVNVMGSIGYLTVGLVLATKWCGVPLLP